jgi:hypothetical protein
VREIHVGNIEPESGLEGFRRDFEWISHVRRGSGAGAALRLWRPPQARISAGRFHRISAGTAGIERRLSGGTLVGLGPGTVGLSLFAPSMAWLDRAVEKLKPAQVLNRAVRPVLSALRTLGVDAVYPGRDIVTLDRRPVAYASFTVLPDGVLVVEMLLALSNSFAETSSLLARFDSDGTAVTDGGTFAQAVQLVDFVEVPGDEKLRDVIAEACEETFDARIGRGGPPAEASVRAGQTAWAAFQAERGPIPQAACSAVGMTQLGVVEVDARIADGKLRDVNVCGDLIAPFETVGAIQANLEGKAPGRSVVRSAIESALAPPGSFLLGGSDLEEIAGRLA